MPNDPRSATSRTWLGIDVGTQGVRAVLIDDEGTVLGTGAHPLTDTLREGNRHEQNPADWWTALCAATSAALADNPPPAAVSIDGTSGTILVQDAAQQPLTAGLMYDDGRGSDQFARATTAGAATWARFGITLQPSWALPRALWLIDNNLVPTGSTIVHQGDHLVSRLIGATAATDSSQALKTGVDLIEIAWPTDVFDQIGLDAALLPEVVLPGTLVGEVTTAAAAATGIPAGTPVKAGLTDGCAAQLAAGAVVPGSWSSALGTTLVLKGTTTDPVVDPSGAIYAHRSPDGGWLPGGASSVGAGIIRRDFPGADLAALTAAAAAHEPAGGVCYPLAGVGERFPFVAPDATGFYDDAPADATDAVRFAAVLQGIAFTERLAYQRLSELGADVTGPISFSGGTARNDYWNQLRCDLLGVPVVVPEHADAAIGSAILAAAEPGTVGATATRLVRHSRRYSPDLHRAARFDAAYHQFVDALVQRGWLSAMEVAR